VAVQPSARLAGTTAWLDATTGLDGSAELSDTEGLAVVVAERNAT
jgi:hypothetical protein